MGLCVWSHRQAPGKSGCSQGPLQFAAVTQHGTQGRGEVPQWPPRPLASLPFPHPWLWNCGRLFKSALGKPRPAPSEASGGLSLPAARCGRGPGPSSPAPPRRLALVLATCLTSAFLPLLPFFFSSSSGPRSLSFSLSSSPLLTNRCSQIPTMCFSVNRKTDAPALTPSRGNYPFNAFTIKYTITNLGQPRHRMSA